MKKTNIQYWGRAAWDTLHIFTFAYPITPCARDKSVAYLFMTSFAEMIPCAKCRKHWTEIVYKGIPSESHEVFSSRTSLSKFVVEGHNQVNKRLGKPEVSYQDALKMYSADFHLDD